MAVIPGKSDIPEVTGFVTASDKKMLIRFSSEITEEHFTVHPSSVRAIHDEDALDKLNLSAAHLSRKSTGFVEHWELYSLQVNIIFRFSDFRKLSYDSHHIGFLSKFGLKYDSCQGPNNCTRTKTSCFSKRSADSRLAGWSIDRTKPNRM